MAHMLEMSTWQNLLMECAQVAAGDHQFTHCDVHQAQSFDAIIFTAYCDQCKQHYCYQLCNTELRAKMKDGIQEFVHFAVREVFDWLSSQPCAAKGSISAIAQWLTDKLAEGPLERLEVAAELWYEKENWDDELVMRVARELGFTDGSTLRLPAEHPLANTA